MQLSDAGEDMWMVSDNPTADIAGARAAGIRATLVRRDRTLIQAAQQIERCSPEQGASGTSASNGVPQPIVNRPPREEASLLGFPDACNTPHCGDRCK